MNSVKRLKLLMIGVYFMEIGKFKEKIEIVIEFWQFMLRIWLRLSLKEKNSLSTKTTVGF